MKVKDLFQQDFKRNIETVVKADDQENILQEVEEFVVTQEIANKVRDFFSAYNNYQGVNGVWISGFFGSGKSHLLKILSYVLENKEYDGKHLGKLFAAKIVGDELLKADVLNAAKIPSESILFNIDQQAQNTTKNEEDAILNVFYKVLNDHLGYYGAQRHVAEFERWVDSDGHYNAFIELYEKYAKEHWSIGRRKYFAPKTKEAVAKALGEIHGDGAEKYKSIIDTLRQDNRISVEDFCDKVNQYISTKGHGFHLNFYVDEVGQFISDNTKLMLNLQTIAESLATKCKGKAWILVTSQEALESVVGDESKAQSEDFSKIQARFKNRMPLTSANVDEVIEKRLLLKNEKAEKYLTSLWKNEQDNLKTILSFSESGVQFKGFKGKEDFVNKYPFLPYQFDLFQQCIKELSKHNAFQGKHASVGERSMLSVFQYVLKEIESSGEQCLVTFDMLFEGIRSTIRGEIQNAITLAERNLNNDFAVNVLKALFLVKYYSNFKTTSRNISVLMIDSLTVNVKDHDTKIKEALNLLEIQTYIQRNGELYEFLTDDEKDVEQEIKATDIDNQQITGLLNEILFDSIIGDNRIKYIPNKQDYDFTRKVDGSIVSKERELTIEIITPNHENFGNTDFYKVQTLGYNTLVLFALPPDERMLKDIRLYLKTDKYVKQSQSTTNKDSIKRILFDKATQNAERRKSIILLAKKLLGESKVYLNGTEHEVGNTSDGKNKVINAFQDLVKLAYSNLKMLGSIEFKEDTIRNIIRSKQDDLFGSDEKTMSEAEGEVYNLIVRRKKQSERTTLADIRDSFVKKPYGWYPNAIWSIVARIYKRGKVEARQDSNLLTDEDLLANLLNNRTHSITLLEPQMEFDQRVVKQAKEFYQEFFDETCNATEPKDVANLFKDKAKAEFKSLNQLIGSSGQYHFLSSLQTLIDLLEKISNMEYNVLLNSVKTFEIELLDQKEKFLDPIKKFWNGEQRKIYDEVTKYIQGDQSNFEYVDGTELQELKTAHDSQTPYAGTLMKDAKAAMERLKEKVLGRIKEEKEVVEKAINEATHNIESRDDFKGLKEEERRDVLSPFNEQQNKVRQQRYIASVRQYGSEIGDLQVKQLNEIQRLITRAKGGDAQEPKVQYIKRANIVVHFEKSELTSEEEVNEYVEALKKEMLRHIKENRRISIQ